VHRGPGIHSHVKYWIRPDIENRIKNCEIMAYFNSTLKSIERDAVVLSTPEGEVRL
jgi:thioredoxin reductase (NADPH)